MNLVVDAGNSFTKLALFSSGELIRMAVLACDEVKGQLKSWMDEYEVKSCIVSSVRESDSSLKEDLGNFFPIHFLSAQTKVPIIINYENPDSLGSDRIANAVACEKEFTGKSCLVVDCGTCITYTTVSRHTLTGGAISPGIDMRFKSLEHYTGKLPLVERTESFALLGTSTESSIRSGVLIGIINEVRGMIEEFSSITDDLHVIITGGDLLLFEQHIKSRIFARPNFTLYGLNEILEIQ
ncbi:MAG: type III pantothenate kinase [Flavobacteriales bacterium]|nr:type III pantothenate kinase [Flavobacteriales bacterium]